MNRTHRISTNRPFPFRHVPRNDAVLRPTNRSIMTFASLLTAFFFTTAIAEDMNTQTTEPAPQIPQTAQIKVRFLGTGAADWAKPDPETGEFRRNSSVLLNGALLIDFTAGSTDMLPDGVKPEVIFYTHSHNDHYSPAAALRLGIKRAYVGETWVERARRDFAAASAHTGIAAPEIIPVTIGEKYTECGLTLTPLPANHVTSDLKEQTLMYLVEREEARLLYATDTSGIPGVAARIAGIDAHCKGDGITGLIMEATMGVDHTDDYRIYGHSSVAVVAQTARVLKMTDRLHPREGMCANIYLTHMARTLHGTQAQIDAALPAPLKAAYDGLEIEF